MQPYWSDADVTLHLGDCLDVLAGMEPGSVDAIITDPPYGLEFMGREWDSFKDAPRRVQGTGGREAPFAHHAVDLSPQRNRGYQEWCERWAAECLRVLKPGGHMLAFGGTRTWHRLACAIEDAGFEIRDSIHWIYGSGFPKSLDVSKAIDKAAGAQRTVLAEGAPVRRMIPGNDQNRTGSWIKDNGREFVPTVTTAATDDAARWSGWETALKPAHEPIIVARKPLTGTVAANVLTHGTGALNIDACRVAHAGDADRAESEGKNRHADFGSGPRENRVYGQDNRDRGEGGNYDGAAGRWPPNIILAPDAAAELDRQSGVLHSQDPRTRASRSTTVGVTEMGTGRSVEYADTGGASRFFPVFRYEAKAGAGERPVIWLPSCDCEDSWPTTSRERATAVTTAAAGLSTSKSGSDTTADRSLAATRSITSTETSRTTTPPTSSPSLRSNTSDCTPVANYATASGGSPAVSADSSNLSASPIGTSPAKAGRSTAAADRATSPRWSEKSSCGNCGAPARREAHATVKPVDLMRWLVRLITPPGGLVLDCFAGSGTTAEACIVEGFRCVLIEKDPAYAELIRTRLHKPIQPAMFGEEAS